eukprot:15364926-Ditylum_brightwellii.AAC.1
MQVIQKWISTEGLEIAIYDRSEILGVTTDTSKSKTLGEIIEESMASIKPSSLWSYIYHPKILHVTVENNKTLNPSPLNTILENILEDSNGEGTKAFPPNETN